MPKSEHKPTPVKRGQASGTTRMKAKKAATTKLTGIENARSHGGKALAKGLEKRKAAAKKVASVTPAARANLRRKTATRFSVTKVPAKRTTAPPSSSTYKRFK